MSSHVLALLICLFFAACAGPEAMSDGGVPVDGAGDAGTVVIAPEIPWLDDGEPPIVDPQLTPCPVGWREVLVAGVSSCLPYSEAVVVPCTGAEAHFPGEVGCRTVGVPCPASDYAAGLPSDGVVYVHVGAAAGGDGRRTTPYARLSEVPWASLDSTSTVALAAGSYDGAVPLRAGVRLVGVCAARTVLTGLAAPVPAVIRVTSVGDPARAEGLSVRAAPQAGVQVERGRALHLEGVVIDDVSEVGILALDAGTEVTLRDVVVRGVRFRDFDGTRGRGVQVQSGARIVASHVSIEGNRDIGLSASGSGTTIVIEDSVVRGTEPNRANVGGRGVNVQLGAVFEGSRLVITDNHDSALYAGGTDALAVLTDVVLMNTHPHSGGTGGGHGLMAQLGARVEASRVLVRNNAGAVMVAQDAGTRVLVTDSLMTGSEVESELAHGIRIEFGARVEFSQVVVAQTTGSGIYAGGDGSEVILGDTRIEGVAHRSDDGAFGRGIAVEEGGRIDATRVSVTAAHDLGIYLSNMGTIGTFTDVVVRRTLPRSSDLNFGRGVDVERGAHFTGSRLLVEENREMGLFADGDETRVLLTDAVVRGTLPAESDRSDGRGVSIQLAAHLDGTRVAIHSNYAFGINVSLGTAQVQDVSIQHTRQAQCGATTCADAPYGYAASAAGGNLRLTRFVVEGADTCGVMLSNVHGVGGGLDLEDGVVRGAVIGACVQIDGYDHSRLSHNVVFTDNGMNLVSTTLPVPEPFGAM